MLERSNLSCFLRGHRNVTLDMHLLFVDGYFEHFRITALYTMAFADRRAMAPGFRKRVTDQFKSTDNNKHVCHVNKRCGVVNIFRHFGVTVGLFRVSPWFSFLLFFTSFVNASMSYIMRCNSIVTSRTIVCLLCTLPGRKPKARLGRVHLYLAYTFDYMHKT